MATQLFFRSGTQTDCRQSHGTNRAKLDGNTSGWQPMMMLTSRGVSAFSISATPVTGPTNGVEFVSGLPVEWYTPPVDAAFTLSGSITFNLRAAESAMTTNAAVNCVIDRVDHMGAVQEEVIKTTRSTELGTSEGAANFSETPGSGVSFNKGDRLRFRVFIDDGGGTMAAGGGSCFFWAGGATAGASGDSYVTLNETISFMTAPTGTTLYPTNTASGVSTASVDRQLVSTRGGGVQTDVTNSAAGFGQAIQVTDTAGGTVVDYFTKMLDAFTLSGAILVNIRDAESSTACNGLFRAEIAVVDSDGTNPVTYGRGSDTLEVGTTEAADLFWIAGDDLSVAQDKRLRLRLFFGNEPTSAMVSGHTGTVWYAGTSGGASGDTFITLSQSITEGSDGGGGGATEDPFPYVGGGYYG